MMLIRMVEMMMAAITRKKLMVMTLVLMFLMVVK